LAAVRSTLHREALSGVFIYTIEGCTRLDTGVALEALDQRWRYMDEKDERSWDWESIAYRIRIDSNER
jgi:hypothetical protein